MDSAFAKIISAFPVERRFWTQLLGASDRQFDDWVTGRRDIPLSVAERLSQAIGVAQEVLLRRNKSSVEPERVLPPLWLKARQSGLDEAGHRAVAASRLLAARYEEVLSLLEPLPNPRTLMNDIKAAVDPQQPARTQGEIAARAFLSRSALGKGAVGIGEVIRGFLRAAGILILETPINSIVLEGFCVPVGGGAGARPCIVANSYRTTWFRRNAVILHEFAHAIFDLDAMNGVFDLDDSSREDPMNIAEQRADAFASHALVPPRLIVAAENRGLRLKEVSEDGLAQLVAATHAEQRLIVRAAREYGRISDADAERLAKLDIARELRARSVHARGLAELPRESLAYPEVHDWGPRLTNFPLEGVRLPVTFIKLVKRAVDERKISPSKAAELLMVDDEGLRRFGIEPARAEEALVS